MRVLSRSPCYDDEKIFRSKSNRYGSIWLRGWRLSTVGPPDACSRSTGSRYACATALPAVNTWRWTRTPPNTASAANANSPTRKSSSSATPPDHSPAGSTVPYSSTPAASAPHPEKPSPPSTPPSTPKKTPGPSTFTA